MILEDGKELLELDCVYRIPTGVSLFNERVFLMPQSYQQLYAALVEEHLDKFLCSMPYTSRHGLNWALISLHFDVLKPLDNAVWLLGQTWHSEHRGPYFRREFRFRSEEGELLLHGTSYSILLDMEKRSVFRGREIPFHVEPCTPEFVVDDVSNRFRETLDFQDMGERMAQNSDIDALGHVNNTRYGAFAYDLFTEEEKDLLQKPFRMELFFISELQQGRAFSLQKAVTEDGLAVRGMRDEEAAFVVRFKRLPIEG